MGGGAARRPLLFPPQLTESRVATSDQTLSAEPGGDVSVDIPPELQAEEQQLGIHGASPMQLARRRLRRDKVALGGGIVFILLIAVSRAAPLWAKHVADTTPEE